MYFGKAEHCNGKMCAVVSIKQLQEGGGKFERQKGRNLHEPLEYKVRGSADSRQKLVSVRGAGVSAEQMFIFQEHLT